MPESYNRTINSLVGAKTNVWDFLKLVRSQEANTRRVTSVKLCRSGHPRKHRQEAGGPGQHSKDQVSVTSFNTTPPQEYIQMIGHELQRGN